MPTLGQNSNTILAPAIDLPQKRYDARRAELLARASVNILIVFGYGSVLGAGTKSHGAMRYLTGWDSHEATSLLIITQHRQDLTCRQSVHGASRPGQAAQHRHR